MMNCPKCKKSLIGDKSVKDKNYKWDVLEAAGFICGGPITMTAAVIYGGARLYNKYGHGDIEIKCPHCKEVITLSKSQYKELQKEIKAVKTKVRQSKQNRI